MRAPSRAAPPAPRSNGSPCRLVALALGFGDRFGRGSGRSDGGLVVCCCGRRLDRLVARDRLAAREPHARGAASLHQDLLHPPHLPGIDLALDAPGDVDEPLEPGYVVEGDLVPGATASGHRAAPSWGGRRSGTRGGQGLARNPLVGDLRRRRRRRPRHRRRAPTPLRRRCVPTRAARWRHGPC